ncbi:MAG: chorismate synthase [Gammaproteobacteria bacterium]|nr:MAG: chorismate synthase [Gammaproteobacteria bacterium]
MGSCIGELFKVSTFGESHGVALGCVVDGCPPNLPLDENIIQPYLNRRKPGLSKFVTQRAEDDRVQILSGVFEGKTTGTSIGMIIHNKDQKSADYESIKKQIRPGHADYTYLQKYGVRDYRGGGRASARETAMRVAAGAIATEYLKNIVGIRIYGFLSQIGNIKPDNFNQDFIGQNPFNWADESQIEKIETYLKKIRKAGDSIGAQVTVIAQNMPVGLGMPVFDRLDADIAKSLMSINAAKAVEIGAGNNCILQQGTQHRDEIVDNKFTSNNAGGVLGGISSGQNIIARVAFKPTSSLIIPAKSIDINNNPVEVITKGRHDPCVGIRAVPIVEAMLAITIMDHYLRHMAQNHNVTPPMKNIL